MPHALLLILLLTLTRAEQQQDSTRIINLNSWNLQLRQNQAIRSPYYDQCKFYTGSVLNEDHSSATITDCEGQLYGLIRVEDEDFVLQPSEAIEGNHIVKRTKDSLLHNSINLSRQHLDKRSVEPRSSRGDVQASSNKKKGHVVRRRDLYLAERTVTYNLTGDTVTAEELERDMDDSPQIRMRHREPETEYMQSNFVTVSRPVGEVKGLWLELALVADPSVLKFHDMSRVKHYILALMNIVSAIFNDPSLDANITLVINKLFLYKEKESVIRHGNVRKSLANVNKWNNKHLQQLPPDSAGWDAAIWLTRAELGGPSGYSPVGGVCSKARSAAIVRDEGLTSAFVIAHELAHLLGLTHDGSEQCGATSSKGSVMAATVLATLHSYAWSSCSKQQFHDKSKSWWCLYERSRDDGVELEGAKKLSHYVFTMDEQCRNEFGDGFTVCKTMKVRAVCSHLWCGHESNPTVCQSKRGPPLEGTPCGDNKWCVDRVCEPMPRPKNLTTEEVRPTAEPPRWVDSSKWTRCSADCGSGLRRRRRRCWYMGCKFEWAVGEWEECSVSCGTSGTQQRQLFCVVVNTSISSRWHLVKSSVSPALCSSLEPPDRMQPCNQLPCPVYWQEMPWTQCSATCGRGTSIRPLYCPASDETLCGQKPRLRSRRCRIKRCDSQIDDRCPTADSTPYCSLFTKEHLQRNCLIPPFYKYCCNACKSVHKNLVINSL